MEEVGVSKSISLSSMAETVPISDIILPLARKRVNARHCQLTLQIAESSTTAINGAISQIRRNETKLSAPRLPMAIDTISTTATAVANFSQTDLVKCFTSLIEKMTVLVKVGNELPKVCLQLSFIYQMRL